jgi:hypothetical protein
MRLARLVAAVAVFAGATACGSGDPFVGEKPPALESPVATWLHADAPLEWKGLIGNVVLLEFGFVR